MNEAIIEAKKQVREHYKIVRREISPERQEQAVAAFLEEMTPLFRQHAYVLSYMSYGTEFPTHTINEQLAQSGQLVLPKVNGDELTLYHVENLEKHLERNALGFLEPTDPCQAVDLATVTLALVPGLAFDANFHRIGYGKGCYDRFLKQISPTMKVYGIGFKEQLSEDPLPFDAHDVPLYGTFLF